MNSAKLDFIDFVLSVKVFGKEIGGMYQGSFMPSGFCILKEKQSKFKLFYYCRWFQGFDWDGLSARNIQSPIQQPVRGPCDTSNFDCFGKDNDIPPDELSNWDENF